MFNNRRVTACLAAASATALLSLAGCGDDDESTDAADQPAAGDPYAAGPETPVTGSLTVASQSGDGKTFLIKSVRITGSGGWVALHADAGGAPGAVAGFVAIPEGTSKNVKVKGDKKLAPGKYWPMLHRDNGTLGTYEFGESKGAVDAPVTAADKPVMKQVAYKVR